jgi:hypothetical protein
MVRLANNAEEVSFIIKIIKHYQKPERKSLHSIMYQCVTNNGKVSSGSVELIRLELRFLNPIET